MSCLYESYCRKMTLAHDLEVTVPELEEVYCVCPEGCEIAIQIQTHLANLQATARYGHSHNLTPPRYYRPCIPG